jgi:hypothetical protein
VTERKVGKWLRKLKLSRNGEEASDRAVASRQKSASFLKKRSKKLRPVSGLFRQHQLIALL